MMIYDGWEQSFSYPFLPHVGGNGNLIFFFIKIPFFKLDKKFVETLKTSTGRQKAPKFVK